MTDEPNLRSDASKPQPAVDRGFRARKLPGTPAGEAKGMLPGMALIAVYLLVLAMLNAFAAARGSFGAGGAKYAILAICTLLVVGIFGLLRLLRWGWAIVSAGCVLMAAGYFYGFHRTHIVPYIIQGLFALVFFLYLSRTEVRDRLR
ncbi:MAG TPA: hypothetical protein VMD97_08995 [Candidatus Aquilonibacter sp.]|nr:hypothetical protein [Candidatus Aquilonibacter sp.]